MAPFRVDDYCSWRESWYPECFVQVVQKIERHLQHPGNHLLVFCKQGARRSACLVGAYLIAKTRSEGPTVFRYLQRLRALLDPVVEKDLIALASDDVFFRCLPGATTVALPKVVTFTTQVRVLRCCTYCLACPPDKILEVRSFNMILVACFVRPCVQELASCVPRLRFAILFRSSWFSRGIGVVARHCSRACRTPRLQPSADSTRKRREKGVRARREHGERY